jgi:ATP-binding cassette subfamily F protein 3
VAGVTVLVASDLTKFFGATLVFSGVSFTVGRGDRIGLVGPNGSGKTTLLEVLTKRLEPDSGQISLVGRVRIGYLEQAARPLTGDGPALFDHALEAMSSLSDREDRLQGIEAEMAGLASDSPALSELMEEYGALREAFEREGGYAREARAKAVLFGLGFGQQHFDLPLGRLSGGQRTRARLARLLLEEPDLLILDEPTNHLDLQAVEWLEEYLGSFPGSVMAVSHDRYFLDHVATRILDLERHRLTAWKGNYTSYVAQKEQSRVRTLEAYEQQQEEIERLEDYVRRYIAGNRSTMAQSRQKALDRIDRIERPVGPDRRASIRFASTELTGREVLYLDKVGFAFNDERDADGKGAMSLQIPREGNRWLFRGLTAQVRRGQRVALLGRNGVGKTTLLDVTVGRRRPTEGRVRWGAGVRVGHFSQGSDRLSADKTLLQEFMDATGFDIPAARSYLARFLFTGDDVHKLVSALSGGERNRLVLAGLVVTEPNVLVLDEPTNHLDLPAREALEAALLEFTGTIIFVSHDRYFIERLATRIWDLDAGVLTDFAGGYREYRLRRVEERQRKIGVGDAAGTDGRSARRARGQVADPARGIPPAPVTAKTPPASSTLSKGRRAQVQRQLGQVQDRISRLERRRGEIESLLSDPRTYREGAGADLGPQYRQVLAELEEALQEWERLATALEGGPGPTR